VGSLELLCYSVVGLAGVARTQDDVERAAQLLGAVEGLRERAGLGIWPVRRELEHRLAAAVRDAFSQRPDQLAAACATGRGMNLESTAALALAEHAAASSAPLSGGVEPSSTSQLTAREQQVAGLIATGKTSKEIADALVITERTADTHAAHIRDKLGLRSRAEIAAWVVRNGLASTAK